MRGNDPARKYKTKGRKQKYKAIPTAQDKPGREALIKSNKEMKGSLAGQKLGYALQR